MNVLLTAALLLAALHMSCSLPANGPLQRLARIVIPGGRSNSNLARSLESPSQLARRVSEDVDFEDEDENIAKRQFDDYGHMRFGRNSPKFDDYGHTRFGK